MVRRVGKTEPGKVRRDKMVIVRQLRNQIAKHMARGGKAVEQQQGGLLWITGHAIENLEAVNQYGLEVDGGYPS